MSVNKKHIYISFNNSQLMCSVIKIIQIKTEMQVKYSNKTNKVKALSPNSLQYYIIPVFLWAG